MVFRYKSNFKNLKTFSFKTNGRENILHSRFKNNIPYISVKEFKQTYNLNALKIKEFSYIKLAYFYLSGGH